jgi:hypothetical protein
VVLDDFGNVPVRLPVAPLVRVACTGVKTVHGPIETGLPELVMNRERAFTCVSCRSEAEPR